jgi:hypothetical protein
VEELPTQLLEVVRAVGHIEGLAPNWINAGPADLPEFGLPEGFAGRAQKRQYGPLIRHFASRVDQVALKVYAAADAGPRSKHFQDLQSLWPSEEELVWAGRWAITHDPSEGFRSLRVGSLAALGLQDAATRL